MGFGNSIRLGFIGYFNFSIRSSRSEYWWWILFWVLGGIIATVVNSIVFGPTIEQSNFGGTMTRYDGGIFGSIFSLVVLIPTIAVSCRRLHDINMSGWWLLIVLIPLIGVLILLYWFVKTGDDGMNRFGANPLARVA